MIIIIEYYQTNKSVTNRLAIHAKRSTIQQKDMILVKEIMSTLNVGPMEGRF